MHCNNNRGVHTLHALYVRVARLIVQYVNTCQSVVHVCRLLFSTVFPRSQLSFPPNSLHDNVSWSIHRIPSMRYYIKYVFMQMIYYVRVYVVSCDFRKFPITVLERKRIARSIEIPNKCRWQFFPTLMIPTNHIDSSNYEHTGLNYLLTTRFPMDLYRSFLLSKRVVSRIFVKHVLVTGLFNANVGSSSFGGKLGRP